MKKQNSWLKKPVTLVIVAVVCIIALLGLTTGLIFFSGFVMAKHKTADKAVIILPGLFASGLFDEATGKDVWDPFTDADMWFTDVVNHAGLNFGAIAQLISRDSFQEQMAHLSANGYSGDGLSFLSLMGMNEDGTPKVSTIKPVPFESESRLRYGVINAQTELYQSLYDNYGRSHTIEVFNYDFRLDNRTSGELLEKHIESKGYKDVILVSHSNGGIVAASYLARSQKNRDKVSLNISIDSPYYGSFAAISTLENIDGMIEGIVNAIKSLPVVGFLGDLIVKAFDTQFKHLVNMWAVYQLLPSFGLLGTQQYYYEYDEPWKGIEGKEPIQKITSVQDTFINIDGEDIIFENAEQLWDFYCSRPWAKMSDGETRPPMAQWLDFQNSMMVTLPDGSSVHSTSLVNTHYINGMGYRNAYKVYYESDGNGGLVLNQSKTEYTDQGDGTVLLYSATAGTKDLSRIHIIPYANHYDVAQQYNYFTEPTMSRIIDTYLGSWSKFLNTAF